MNLRLSLGFAAAVLASTACTAGVGDSAAPNASSEVSAPRCEPHHDEPGVDLSSPTVSFRGDVMPILRRTCAFGSCHGGGGAAGGLSLGSRTSGEADAAAIRAALVGRPSRLLPSMPEVTPGDPAQSFLMRKLDGDACALDASCAGGSCGEAMPKGGDPLAAEERGAIRRWIAQGARDD